ncbi:CHAT domain-containing protein [Kitasatospora sp. NBC_00240]|uniref:CHAT domain-containing tetratricopeptide repeat protein n=1 Tax=Kitasatospora sp. NBC_00240 TaxID=2903567 RepID=UPI002257DAA7|nr:CHAT domain-containing protein [Kitasatospora sp. NBC_00240]MCX5215854.1 CHAT domain-containing protein [Kitasatospora sp. NBC_00240]
MEQWEELSAEVWSRLRRITGREDLPLVLEPRAVEQVTELTTLLASPNISVQVSIDIRYLLGWMHYYRSEALPPGDDVQDRNAALEMLTPIFISHPEAVAPMPKELLPALAARAAPAAIDLLRRAEGSSDPDVHDSAVGLWRRMADAIPAANPVYPAIQSNIGYALRSRFARFGEREDLEDAMHAGRAAVDATGSEDPDRALRLSNFGAMLGDRFERFGERQDLDDALSVLRLAAAVDASAPQDNNRTINILANLGHLRRTRFDRFGSWRDIDDAISSFRAAGAVGATTHEAPDRDAEVISDLAYLLSSRYVRMGGRRDLDEAIELVRAALLATPAEDPERLAHLSDLEMMLGLRFARYLAPEDLDGAVEAGRELVESIPAESVNRASSLTSLGVTLAFRFGQYGEKEDLDQAINLEWDALRLRPDDAFLVANILSNLGLALRIRFEEFGDLDDLEEAIYALRAATRLVPVEDPDYASLCFNLGIALQIRYERQGEVADLQDAASQYVAAANVELARPNTRIKAARAAAVLNAEWDPHEMSEVLETAVRLLPEVASPKIESGDRNYILGLFTGVASDAAALALSDTQIPESQRAARALRLLEGGRAVLLSQALDTRSDITDLREQQPRLAQRYIELRDLLDQSSDAGIDRHVAVGDFHAVLDEIRSLPGFASFARMPSIEEWLPQAASGPVVSFSVSPFRSDAMLMTTNGITSVNLPLLDIDTLKGQVKTFHEALGMTGDTNASFSDRKRAQGMVREMLVWLWEAAAEPVLDALGYRGPPSDDWPRVWWATGGLLGLLPLHAAGHHGPGLAGESVMDRVVSSYTPTIRALDYARRQYTAASQTSAATDDVRSLVVAMPTTPGQRALPFAAEEAALLASRLPSPALLVEPDHYSVDGADKAAFEAPTLSAVLDELPRCAIAHFACHGAHDTADPSRSYLLLHDHATAPLTIASLAPVRLERARLAYLSACRTAFHGTEMYDEAVHLAAAFQLAGFPHVIAALWEIYDPIAITIAESFYDQIRTSSTALEPSRAAVALHHAIRALRDKHPNLPSLWASYIHAGA